MSPGLAAQTEHPRPCVDHPHHASVDHCDRCRRRFCPECLVRGVPGRPELLCRACWQAAPEYEARAARRRHPLYRRLDALRENRPSVIAGSIIVGVLAFMALAGAAQVLSPGYLDQVGEAVVAARRGQPVPTATAQVGQRNQEAGSRVATLMSRLFGSPAAVAEMVPGSQPEALVDGLVGPSAPAWRSPAGMLLPDLHLRVHQQPNASPSVTDRVLFAHSAATPPEKWAKEVEVWIALRGDGTDAVQVGRWTLVQTTDPQTFRFAPTPASSVRLRVLANYGSDEYTSLAEVALLSPDRAREAR